MMIYDICIPFQLFFFFMNIKEKKLANISTSATGLGMRDGGSRDNGDAKHD
jgi:hypothetical protein